MVKQEPMTPIVKQEPKSPRAFQPERFTPVAARGSLANPQKRRYVQPQVQNQQRNPALPSDWGSRSEYRKRKQIRLRFLKEYGTYLCSACDYKHVNSKGRNSHEEDAHGFFRYESANSTLGKSSGTFHDVQCEVCDLKFGSRREADIHMRNEHCAPVNIVVQQQQLNTVTEEVEYEESATTSVNSDADSDAQIFKEELDVSIVYLSSDTDEGYSDVGKENATTAGKKEEADAVAKLEQSFTELVSPPAKRTKLPTAGAGDNVPKPRWGNSR